MNRKMSLFLVFTFLTAVYSTTPQNLLVNSDFTQTACTAVWCISQSSDEVTGWTPDPQIKIGYGRFYSRFLNHERVLELTSNSHSCIFQIIKNLQPGNYELNVEYFPQFHQLLEKPLFSISFNDVPLKEVQPSGTEIQTETIDFPVNSSGDGKLRFCSIEVGNDDEGAILKSISLIKKSDDSPQQTQSALNQPQFPQKSISQLTMDSHSEKCFQKPYQISGGPIIITFDYKIKSSSPVKDSATFVTISGQPIYKLDSSSIGMNIKLQGSLEKGQHLLGFCPSGSANDPVHQIVIQNIVLSETQCKGEWSDNLIVNGGFEINTCRSNNCNYNERTTPNKVQGWKGNPHIEIIRGLVANSELSLDWVAELARNVNKCIQQKINLKPGKIQASFKWAARVRKDFRSKGFEMKLNGQVIKSYSLRDFTANKQTFEFNVQRCPPEGSLIEFCGTGPNNTAGVLIDDISIRKFIPCGNNK